MSAGRGVQATFSPSAQCTNDLAGVSAGVGFDSPYGGASVGKGSGGNTITVSGPSFGASLFGFISNTVLGSPVTITPVTSK